MRYVIPRTERLPALPEGLEWKTAPEPFQNDLLVQAGRHLVVKVMREDGGTWRVSPGNRWTTLAEALDQAAEIAWRFADGSRESSPSPAEQLAEQLAEQGRAFATLRGKVTHFYLWAHFMKANIGVLRGIVVAALLTSVLLSAAAWLFGILLLLLLAWGVALGFLAWLVWGLTLVRREMIRQAAKVEAALEDGVPKAKENGRSACS